MLDTSVLSPVDLLTAVRCDVRTLH